MTSLSSSEQGARGPRWRWSEEWDARDSLLPLAGPTTAASAVRLLLLLLLLLWDTWSPTAKKTQLGSQPGNVICASLRTALHISKGSFAQIGVTLGLCLHRALLKLGMRMRCFTNTSRSCCALAHYQPSYSVKEHKMSLCSENTPPLCGSVCNSMKPCARTLSTR